MIQPFYISLCIICIIVYYIQKQTNKKVIFSIIFFIYINCVSFDVVVVFYNIFKNLIVVAAVDNDGYVIVAYIYDAVDCGWSAYTSTISLYFQL